MYKSYPNCGIKFNFKTRSKRRTRIDFAEFMKILITEKYSDAEFIRLITDNLNIHNEKSFYEAFSEDEAKKILDKIEFHYTPKHASVMTT